MNFLAIYYRKSPAVKM